MSAAATTAGVSSSATTAGVSSFSFSTGAGGGAFSFFFLGGAVFNHSLFAISSSSSAAHSLDCAGALKPSFSKMAKSSGPRAILIDFSFAGAEASLAAPFPFFCKTRTDERELPLGAWRRELTRRARENGGTVVATGWSAYLFLDEAGVRILICHLFCGGLATVQLLASGDVDRCLLLLLFFGLLGQVLSNPRDELLAYQLLLFPRVAFRLLFLAQLLLSVIHSLPIDVGGRRGWAGKCNSEGDGIECWICVAEEGGRGEQTRRQGRSPFSLHLNPLAVLNLAHSFLVDSVVLELLVELIA